MSTGDRDVVAESEALRRVRVILADYASGARGATSSLMAIEAAVTTDLPSSPPANSTGGDQR